MTTLLDPAHLVITPFAWEAWADLWAIRFAHLAEHGIVLGDTTPPDRDLAVSADDPEWDFHQLQRVYLSGSGRSGMSARKTSAARSSCGGCMCRPPIGGRASARHWCARW